MVRILRQHCWKLSGSQKSFLFVLLFFFDKREPTYERFDQNIVTLAAGPFSQGQIPRFFKICREFSYSDERKLFCQLYLMKKIYHDFWGWVLNFHAKIFCQADHSQELCNDRNVFYHEAKYLFEHLVGRPTGLCWIFRSCRVCWGWIAKMKNMCKVDKLKIMNYRF